jgi:hypothetical protein
MSCFLFELFMTILKASPQGSLFIVIFFKFFGKNIIVHQEYNGNS